MDFISLLNVLFIVIYAGILGLVAPYVGVKSESYGSFVPTALGVISGSVLWILLTWAGLHYDEAWIWVIVMLGMPESIFAQSVRIMPSDLSLALCFLTKWPRF